MLFVLKGRPRPRDVFLGSVIDGAFGRPVEQHRVLTSAAAARHHNPFTMAPVPTLQEIFAAAFASIRKAELAEKAAHVAENDVWIADALALDNVLLLHRKQHAQGVDDTTWVALFGTLVEKDVIPDSTRLRVKDAVAAALDHAFRPPAAGPPPPPEVEAQQPSSFFAELQQGAQKEAKEETPLPWFMVCCALRRRTQPS